MSKIRQALQLLADASLSTRQVAAALGISKTTVSEIAMYARDAGVRWPQAAALSDDELQSRLYPPPRPRSCTRREPDYAALHQELKRPGVTLQLLWEEYSAGAGEAAYRYSAFCEKYRAWAKSLKRSMRQIHPGGERLFVDYAGQTVPVVRLWVRPPRQRTCTAMLGPATTVMSSISKASMRLRSNAHVLPSLQTLGKSRAKSAMRWRAGASSCACSSCC